MMVIGVDTHKRNHALSAIDEQTGRRVAERQIHATEAGHLDAVRWAAALGDERVWAIEDCRHVSGHLERALLAGGERVIRVAPALTGPSRRRQRAAGKSDQIDALAVARAAVREGVDTFPAAGIDERAADIRMLSDHRQQLVAERTRQINQLRWGLVAIDPALEASLGHLDLAKWQNKVSRRLARLGSGVAVRIAKTQLSRIIALTRQEHDLEKELAVLVAQHSPQLLAEPGCGPISAAILIGHASNPHRFASEAKFARHAGTAPIPASSGSVQHHRLDHGGDRQLNRAIHTIALSRARTHPETQAYLARKTTHGKTQRDAIRALKRQLARRIYRLLTQPPPPSAPSLTNNKKPQTANIP